MMIPTIIERAAAALVFAAAFAGIVRSIVGVSRWSARKQTPVHALAAGLHPEEPTLLYFWGPGCAQCRPQERQIDQAKETLLKTGRKLTVLKVNALDEQPLAQSLRVMTLPTTVLLDLQGKVAAWNPGLTTGKKIVKQYQTIG